VEEKNDYSEMEPEKKDDPPRYEELELQNINNDLDENEPTNYDGDNKKPVDNDGDNNAPTNYEQDNEKPTNYDNKPTNDHVILEVSNDPVEVIEKDLVDYTPGNNSIDDEEISSYNSPTELSRSTSNGFYNEIMKEYNRITSLPRK